MNTAQKKQWWQIGILCAGLFVVVTTLVLWYVRDTERAIPVPEKGSLTVVPEKVITPRVAPPVEPEVPPPQKPLAEYITVTDGCDIHFQGECLLVRSGPGKEYPVVAKLRNNIVLKTSSTSVDADSMLWYKVVFDEFLLFPERVLGEWYVASAYVEKFEDVGVMTSWDSTSTPATTTKKIIVDRSKQKLFAYEGDTLFMEIPVSTGLPSTPTPRGIFSIFRKTPTRYMQGPLPNLASNQYYDLPGVPWNLYFTDGGAVIHGAYWHDSFGSRYSHGCVNLAPADAQKLYYWAPLGTEVVVRD